jgi:hypothetical protein
MPAKKRVDEMTEEELARHLYENREDTSLWETTPRKIRVRRGGPSSVFSVRFTLDELRKLQAAADVRRTTVSALIREAALEAVAKSPLPK